MDEGKRQSLLVEGRDEVMGGFHPLLLWRDRGRILAEPEVATRPRPPLANSPLRFSLALGLTPLLVVAWLMAALVDLNPGSGSTTNRLEQRSETAVDVLQEALPPGFTREAVRNLARAVRPRDMAPEARELSDSVRSLMFFSTFMPAADRRARLEAWIREVRASSLPPAVQSQLIAQQLDMAYTLRRADRLAGEIERSFAQGGPLMQVLGVLSIVFSAWIFGQMLRNEPRFPRAGRADAFYLYYTTSRVFWFLPAQALAYGAGSFASARGDETLFFISQASSLAISGASLLYLLLGARTMARVLAGGETVPGGAFAIAWRMLVGMLVGLLAMLVVFSVLGIAVGYLSMSEG